MKKIVISILSIGLLAVGSFASADFANFDVGKSINGTPAQCQTCHAATTPALYSNVTKQQTPVTYSAKIDEPAHKLGRQSKPPQMSTAALALASDFVAKRSLAPDKQMSVLAVSD